MGKRDPEARTREILWDTRSTLDTAYFGLTVFTGHHDKTKVYGLRIVVVFGRATTNVLQGLRGAVGTARFDGWYAPYVAEMRADPLMHFFYDMRTTVLKIGAPADLSQSVEIGAAVPGGVRYTHAFPTPLTHLGLEVDGDEPERLARLYLDYMDRLVTEAEREFGV
jgi:hypothetical protein